MFLTKQIKPPVEYVTKVWGLTTIPAGIPGGPPSGFSGNAMTWIMPADDEMDSPHVIVIANANLTGGRSTVVRWVMPVMGIEVSKFGITVRLGSRGGGPLADTGQSMSVVQAPCVCGAGLAGSTGAMTGTAFAGNPLVAVGPDQAIADGWITIR